MHLNASKPALLLIDIQKGLDETSYYGGMRNNPNAETHAAQILQLWRKLSLPVYFIQHSSQYPASPLHASKPGFAIKREVAPNAGEPVIVKNVNSAFIGTDLKEQLDARKITTLILVGLTTNHCVSTTARMAGNFGYRTIIISDATAAFDRVGINGEMYNAETVHLTALASLKDEFAEILTTKQLFTLLEG